YLLITHRTLRAAVRHTAFSGCPGPPERRTCSRRRCRGSRQHAPHLGGARVRPLLPRLDPPTYSVSDARPSNPHQRPGAVAPYPFQVGEAAPFVQQPAPAPGSRCPRRWRIPRPANALLDEAENCPLHPLVTLRKCSTLYNFPTNSPSTTARAPAGGTYSVNPP